MWEGEKNIVVDFQPYKLRNHLHLFGFADCLYGMVQDKKIISCILFFCKIPPLIHRIVMKHEKQQLSFI